MLQRQTTWLQSATIAILLVTSANSVLADDPPGVSLILTTVSAELDEKGDDVSVHCDVILLNETDKELKVKSNFSSAFDGLDLVITSLEGKVLIQRQFTYHQSPFAEDKEYVLKRGKTKVKLVFPLSAFGKEGETFKARLVGVLPGSEFYPILSTDTQKITLKKKPRKNG